MIVLSNRDRLRRTRDGRYAHVYLSDRLPTPQVFALFYTQFPPQDLRGLDSPSVRQGNWSYTDFSFGKFHVDALAETRRPPLQRRCSLHSFRR